jgi:DNA-binding NarL/FixJ family response regulator
VDSVSEESRQKVEKITVFLADWQVLFREGIHFTLCGEDDMEVIAEATSGEEALGFIEASQPSVAVLNIDGGRLSGIEATYHIKRNFPSVSVILVTDSDDDEHIFSAVKCGASAYLTKDIDPVDLVNVIRQVAQGVQLISKALLRPGIASLVINEFEVFASINEQVENIFAHLSSTEADILRRIAEGSPTEQIAQVMGIDEEAIEHHLEIILSKLVSNDRNRELIEAAQRGLPPIISRTGKSTTEYVTKEEFNAFKENLGERLKSFIEELSSARREEMKTRKRTL